MLFKITILACLFGPLVHCIPMSPQVQQTPFVAYVPSYAIESNQYVPENAQMMAIPMETSYELSSNSAMLVPSSRLVSPTVALPSADSPVSGAMFAQQMPAVPAHFGEVNAVPLTHSMPVPAMVSDNVPIGGFPRQYSYVPAMAMSNGQYVSVPRAPVLSAPATNVLLDTPLNPVNLVYRSVSSPVRVRQVHMRQPAVYRHTESVDNPMHYVHTVTKPVIQELHEIIAPVRKVKQQVLPVQQEVDTVLANGVTQSLHN